MKIRYNSYVANPELRNTETNLPAHIAQVLIAQGVAVHVPYKDFRDRIASESALLPKPKPPVVEWGVQEGGQYTQASVIKRHANGTTFFRTPPADCPPSVVAKWKELTDGVEPAQYAPDEARMLEAAYSVGDSNKRSPVVIGHDKAGKPITRDPGEFISRK